MSIASFPFEIIITGFEEVRDAIIKMEKNLQPRGGMEAGLFEAAVYLSYRAGIYTHKDTSTLSVSYLPEQVKWRGGRPESRVYVTDNINPKTGLPASSYAGTEDARGGEHAFFDITLREEAENMMEKFDVAFERGMS